MTSHAPVTLPEFSLRDRVQSFLASGLLAAALPFLAIYYLMSRGRSQSSRRYLRERLGNLPSNLCQAAPGAIWDGGSSSARQLSPARRSPLGSSTVTARFTFLWTSPSLAVERCAPSSR